MGFKPETLKKISEDGRKAAEAGQSPAANPYFQDMNNERFDAWIEGYRSFVRPL